MIVRLAPDVVMQIAAGEIVQRPFNAIKELLENALDAKATKVAVYANELAKLQVTDNGSGILKEDFARLCVRHSTSKLKQLSDLQTISTFGFRGEGLASISAVSFVTVRSRTPSSEVAFEAAFERGAVKGPVRPVPGNPGTTITVENLYYNDREKRDFYAAKVGDELKLIEKLVQSYAIHNSNIAFSFKREKTTALLVSTPGATTPLAVIGTVFSKHAADNLLPLSLNLQEMGIRVDGYVTNGLYSGPKTHWIVFVNNRLISDAPEFKKAVKGAYDQVYNKQKKKPLVYLSISVDPRNVDVNCDPCKARVRILRDVEAAAALRERVVSMLSTFETTQKQVAHRVQQTLTGKEPEAKRAKKTSPKEKSPTGGGVTSPVSKVMPRAPPSPKAAQHASPLVQGILSEFADAWLPEWTTLMKKHHFLGVVEPSHSAVQIEDGLYVVNHIVLSRAIAFQYAVSQIGRYDRVRLGRPVSVFAAVRAGLDSPREGYDASKDAPIDDCAASVAQLLGQNCDFYRDSFGIELRVVNDELSVVALPKHPFAQFPDIVAIPSLLIALAYDVTYDAEGEEGQRELLKQCALVVTNKLLLCDHTSFAPRPVPLVGESQQQQQEGGSVKCAKLQQATQSAAFADAMVWEKQVGVAVSYIVEQPTAFYHHVTQELESDDQRTFVNVLLPARPVKFVGLLMLRTVERLERLAHVRQLQALVSKLWAFQSTAFAKPSIEAGWRVVCTDDFSTCLVVNACARFSEVRTLNAFLALLHNDFLHQPNAAARRPFFKSVREGAKLPLCFGKSGAKDVFKPLEEVADRRQFFLDCLPHHFSNPSLAVANAEEAFVAMPVHTGEGGSGRVVQEWLGLIRNPSFVLPDTSEVRAALVTLTVFNSGKKK
jgi:DNA mismatch repair protein MLH1